MTTIWKAPLWALLAWGVCGCVTRFSQTISEVPPPASRIVLPINEERLVPLHGNTRPEAKPESDLGGVDPQLPMARMLLVLRRSPEHLYRCCQP